MSFSKTFQDDLYALAVARVALNDQQSSWQAAVTAADRVVAESNTIDMITDYIDDDKDLYIVRQLDNPDEDTYTDFYRWVDLKSQILRSYQSLLRTRLLEHLADTEAWKANLGSKQQRLQALVSQFQAMQGRYRYSHILSPSDPTFVDSGPTTLAVWPDESIITLAEKSQVETQPSSVRVGADSNGVPGNSDEAVTINNINAENVLTSDESLFFEYERLDTGPLRLVMQFNFDTSRFINKVVITPIDEIRLVEVLADGDRVFGPKLTGEYVAEEFTYRFAPVAANRITLRFEDTSPEDVVVDGTVRPRYAVAISRVRFHSVQYVDTGVLYSNDLEYPAGLYAVEHSVQSRPSTALGLHTAVLQVGTDGSFSESIQADGSPGTFQFKLDVVRDNLAVAQAVLTEQGLEDSVGSLVYVPETKSVPVSRVVNPTKIDVPDAEPTSLYVYRPQQIAFGEEDDRLELTNGFGAISNIRLPYNLLEYDIDANEVHLYSNGVELTYVEDNSSVGSGQWSFTDDQRSIVLHSSITTDDLIEFVVDPEPMDIYKQSDGYYHRTRLPIDPDLGVTKVKQLPYEDRVDLRFLRVGRTVHHLRATYITSLEFPSNTRSEVANKAALTGSNEYYVDKVNGILYLSEAATSVERCWVRHRSPETVEDVSFVWEEGQAVGVRMNGLTTESFTESVGDSLFEVMDPSTGVYGVRATLISGVATAKQLSYQRILRGTLSVTSDLLDSTGNTIPIEVDYIDGAAEFLGLVEMTNEFTTSLVGDGSNLVTFNLAAGSYWYNDEDPVFSDTTYFDPAKRQSDSSTVLSSGQWHVSNAGLVTVYVASGTALPDGIQIIYRYRDPDFVSSDKYSVDYEQGIVYGGRDLFTGANISYQVGAAVISYQAVRPIVNWELEQDVLSVSMPFVAWRNANRALKVAYRKAPGTVSLDVSSYYTPFIGKIKHQWS